MKTFVSIIFMVMGISLYAQENQSKVVTVQPKIMVIPYVKQGEDLRLT